MRIAYVTPYYPPARGGVSAGAQQLAEWMVAQGHEVHVFTSDWDTQQRMTLREETLAGVQVHRCFHWFRVAKFVTFFPSVFFRLLSGRFDLIHTHVYGHPHSFFAFVVAKILHVPFFISTHSPWKDADRGTLGTWLYKYNLLSCLTLRYATRIFALSSFEFPFIRARFGHLDTITVAPNGTPAIFYQRHAKNTFRRQHKIREHFVVLYFGRFDPVKGAEQLAYAAKKIIHQRSDIAFLFVGPDAGTLPFTKQILAGLSHVYFFGLISHPEAIASLYATADVYVIPSRFEGLPLTLAEALASGVPVLASPVGGIPFVMHEPENGFFVPYGDVDLLVERLLHLLDNASLRSHISKRNKIAAQTFHLNTIGQTILHTYEAHL